MNKSYYERYCYNIENVENYEAAERDNFNGWHCHHRLETHNSDGERRFVDISSKELVALDMYYNRPADELIFLTVAEHTRLHHKDKKMPAISEALKGKKHSEETKAKISAAKKGTTFSEEHKAKISAAKKGTTFSEEHKAKISAAMKGKKRSGETKAKLSAAKKGKNNPMYGKTFSEETKKRLSAAKKGKHWKLVDGKRVWY